MDPTLFQEKVYEFAHDSELGRLLLDNNEMGFKDDRLIYFQINTIAAGEPRDPHHKAYPVYEKWVQYIDRYKETAPDGMKCVDATAWWWAFIITEQAFVTEAVQGMLIATVLCFIILLIAI